MPTIRRTRAHMVVARTLLIMAILNDALLGLYFMLTHPVGPFYTTPLLPYNALLLTVWLWLSVMLTAWALYDSRNTGFFFEGRINRQFEGVCHAVGMYRARQESDGKGGYLTVWDYPKLRRLCGDGNYFEAEVQTIIGHTVNDYQKATAKFALAFEVCALRFEQTKQGKLKLYACKDAAVSFPIYEPEPVELLRLDVANYDTAHPGDSAASKLLYECPIGVKEDGSAYKIAVMDSHLLIAGSSRAGKGSYIWSIVIGLAPAIAAGYVKLWGFDPKRVELAIAPNWWAEYADSPESLIEKIEQAEREMWQRTGLMKGTARKFAPSPDTPLNLLVIDELGYLSALLPDKKQQARAERALQAIMSQGAAMGFCVVGAIQDPRKETLPYRDLFTRRIALRLPADMVDLVLGKQAREQGALCDHIPQNDANRGVAYANSDEDPAFVRVRAYHHSDQTLREWSNLIMHAVAGRMAAESQADNNQVVEKQEVNLWQVEQEEEASQQAR